MRNKSRRKVIKSGGAVVGTLGVLGSFTGNAVADTDVGKTWSEESESSHVYKNHRSEEEEQRRKYISSHLCVEKTDEGTSDDGDYRIHEVEISTLNSAVKEEEEQKDDCDRDSCETEVVENPALSEFDITMKARGDVLLKGWTTTGHENPYIQGGPAYEDGDSRLDDEEERDYLDIFKAGVGILLSAKNPAAGALYTAGNVAISLALEGIEDTHDQKIEWDASTSEEWEKTYAANYRKLEIWIPTEDSSGTVSFGTQSTSGGYLDYSTIDATIYQ
jgi:hypothetical protein